MAVAANPMFKFSRDSFAVQVANIPCSVSRREIVELFSSLIGEVRICDELVTEGERRSLELTFYTQDASKKALCMSGYNVSGIALLVTASSDTSRSSRQGRQMDARRNLYVLGLPFDLTKPEFIELFSRYGQVSHAVILATVDNASRRRGFVVMSTHSEARSAMEALGRKEIKGHTVDVSWAVVQRSHGFLDGGDRTTALANRSPSPSSGAFEYGNLDLSSAHVQSAVSPVIVQPNAIPRPALSGPTSTLLVMNLPAAFFSQPADLHPLFCPFGEIVHLKIMDPSSLDVAQGNISVLAEYKTALQAKEACDALQGQMYTNFPVEVVFLQTPSIDSDVGWDQINDTMKTVLNPNAMPFTIHASGAVTASASPILPVYNDRGMLKNTAMTPAPRGHLAINRFALPSYAIPSPYSHYLSPSVGGVRPNSAPSCWSENPHPTYTGQWMWSTSNISNLSTPSLTAHAT